MFKNYKYLSNQAAHNERISNYSAAAEIWKEAERIASPLNADWCSARAEICNKLASKEREAKACSPDYLKV